MILNTSKWKNFCLDKLFTISAGIYHYSDEYDIGDTPYISASNENNGIQQRINLDPEFSGDCIITGKVGCTTFYQSEDFCATSDVNIFRPKNFELNRKIGLFITAIINFSENYKWNYGRQCRVGDSKKIIIKLPTKMKDDVYVIDSEKIFSDEGYIPDFDFINQFMEYVENGESVCEGSIKDSLRTTNMKWDKSFDIKIANWKDFYLHKLFKTRMGNGIDAVVTTNYNPKYNYVSRDSNGNGVVGFVDEIEGEEPFPAGTMSLALGGSFLGSCFIQKESFYTAQNVGVLQEREPLSIYTKLFIATLIRNECKIKYQAFGRELNSHFRKDFTIKLPIKMDKTNIVYDENKFYSDEGYIPDWEFMDNFIKNLPYGDRI
ncbi:restriction endonuclease subunit S [Veillonella sp. CHU110]|uniref:restriction endonuclease subunit S n=1 Tax=Veillonella sp. CHU110 TaxID=2490947 RepID=UPI000F8C51C3|nr:restriction endonuclease subunit S [Veillonella sp. CHU110]